MRSIDALECAAHGLSPKQALLSAWRTSEEVHTVLVDGKAEAMFGVRALRMMEGSASPWLLTSDKGLSVTRVMLPMIGAILLRWGNRWPLLDNEIHADNRSMIRVLRTLDFVVDDEVNTIGGVPMRRFHRRCATPRQP